MSQTKTLLVLLCLVVLLQKNVFSKRCRSQARGLNRINSYSYYSRHHQYNLRIPKTICVDQNYVRGGFCPSQPSSCARKRISPKIFECEYDLQCPKGFKCCYHDCFSFKICKRISREQPDEVTTAPKTTSPQSVTETEETTTEEITSTTETTTAEVTTTEPTTTTLATTTLESTTAETTTETTTTTTTTEETTTVTTQQTTTTTEPTTTTVVAEEDDDDDTEITPFPEFDSGDLDTDVDDATEASATEDYNEIRPHPEDYNELVEYDDEES